MKNLTKLFASLVSFLFLLNSNCAFAGDTAKPVNPNFSYFMEGKPIPGWTMQLGDDGNRGLQVTDRKSTSANQKIVIEPTGFNSTDDALLIRWTSRSTSNGDFALYGNPIDLSSVENQAELSFVIRMDKKPTKEVTLSMDCGYPCRGSVHFTKALMSMKLHEWTTYAVPLNCFKKEKLDITKINGPVIISTDGKLEISINDIRMQKMPEGEKGCAAPTLDAKK